MNIDEFDYELPEELIAQQPIEPRDQSRLLRVDRETQSLHHHIFADLPELLRPNDLLILNNTKVIPARLYGHRQSTGGKWEGLYLQSDDNGNWELLCQTRGKLQVDEVVEIPAVDETQSSLELCLIGRSNGHWIARPLSDKSTLELLDAYGQMPLPPYIRKGQATIEDRTRYQTLYAETTGAVAAPTAGLHFTDTLFQRLEQRGVRRAFVTLHVGLGTFQPVKVNTITEHQMHEEWGELTQQTVDAITQCRQAKGRVIAVGTTSTRVLETVAAQGELQPWAGVTDLFIYPPYPFRVIDGMITNFHLPRSTLLMLLGAFTGMELMKQAYQLAVEERYRFYSYGDAMLIV